MTFFGYPMKLVEFNRFTDIVSGRPVNLYESKGKLYLAESRWSLFRVEKNSDAESLIYGDTNDD